MLQNVFAVLKLAAVALLVAVGLVLAHGHLGGVLATDTTRTVSHGAFVGEHGSWNRASFHGYKVVYIPFRDGKPAGAARDVVTGFLAGDQARGRPVGLGIDGTGALLVADDVGNTVWRVAAADGSVTRGPRGTDR